MQANIGNGIDQRANNRKMATPGGHGKRRLISLNRDSEIAHTNGG
jgi:hypothetical protein